MGGGEIITTFCISQSRPHEKYHINSSVSLSESDLSGIRLGMTKNDFLKFFPNRFVLDKSKPEYQKWDFGTEKPDLLISFSNKVKMTKEDIEYFHIENKQDAYYDQGITIIPTFSKEKLIKLSVDKATSN